YGTDFMYEEAVIKGDGEKGEKRAKKAASDARKFMTLVAFAPTRWILERFILPKPGEGPTPEEQLNGSYDLRFMGTSPQGEKIEVKVTGDRDPGYGSTAKMLGQAACSIAFDIDQDTAGGFWTPATLLGDRLIERLKSDAGLTFDVIG
ncbi:MAG TPA: saccharopine dehydrogenase, partial [Cellvibrionales bacterium]|nr:saccharopine dehydrogenase [Cellvibrionales bacterium]